MYALISARSGHLSGQRRRSRLAYVVKVGDRYQADPINVNTGKSKLKKPIWLRDDELLYKFTASERPTPAEVKQAKKTLPVVTYE